jgi:protein-disulfide isomerase/uncharacterized membrane protein
MRIAQRLPVTRLLALTALTGSAVLLAAHWHPGDRTCGFGSACDEVSSSRFGQVLGVPLPLLGLLAFGPLLGLSLFPSPSTRWLHRAMALAGGIGGLVLILLQVGVLGRVCPYCLAVDVSAVLLGLLEVRGWHDPPPQAPGRRGRLLWLGATAAALGAGVLLGSVGTSGAGPRPTPVPPEVSALWVPGKVNVVEVADFQCPHCRQMHAVLALFLDEEGDRVHFVRVAAPLPGHPQARPASRAYLCAARQGRGDDMAEALFAAADLTPEACDQLAASLGLATPAFRACVADPATDEQLDADVAWVRRASPQGVPVVWVQDQMLYGVQPVDALRKAARAAERNLERSER